MGMSFSECFYPDLFHVRSCSLKVKHLGIEAAREAAKRRVSDIKFEPKGKTDLSEPKFGKEDPKNEEHSGGNTWAGGVSIFIHICCDLNGSERYTAFSDRWPRHCGFRRSWRIHAPFQRA